MFVLSSIILFLGSLNGVAKNNEELSTVIYDPFVLKNKDKSVKIDKLLTLLLILGVVLIWFIFSPLILATV